MVTQEQVFRHSTSAKPKPFWWFWKDIFLTENLIPEQAASPCCSGSHAQAACLQRSPGWVSQKAAALAAWHKLKTMVMSELLQEGGAIPEWSVNGWNSLMSWTQKEQWQLFFDSLGENPPVSGKWKVWHKGWFHGGYAAIYDLYGNAKNTGKSNKKTTPTLNPDAMPLTCQNCFSCKCS